VEDEEISKRDIYGGEKDWSQLIGFVKNRIMKLPNTCSIPQNIILRLDGFSKGQYICKDEIEPKARYQYKDILISFKYAEVLMGKKTDFESSQHRFNYAMKIVESKINDVVIARKKKENYDEKISNINLDILTHEQADYIPKKLITNSKLVDKLW